MRVYRDTITITRTHRSILYRGQTDRLNTKTRGHTRRRHQIENRSLDRETFDFRFNHTNLRITRTKRFITFIEIFA